MSVSPRVILSKLPAKQRVILGTLRRDIVEGRLSTGGRLPTHIELSQRFGVSNVTIQRALDRLAQEGFITARGRSGTFVSDQPPHLSRYGLVFPDTYNEQAWQGKRFWLATAQEWMKLSATRQNLALYSGINDPDSHNRERLIDDLNNHRLAGIVVLVPSLVLPVLGDSIRGIPTVALSSTADPGSDVRRITFDDTGWLNQCIEVFRRRQCRRVAALTTVMQGPDFVDRLIRALADAGIEMRPNWVQACDPARPSWARNSAHLLMDRPTGERPDGVLISDDNLLEHAANGIRDAGVFEPNDLTVVSHCNFPWPTSSIWPVVRVGYDVRDFLRSALEMIDEARAGRVPESRVVRAVTEHESNGHLGRMEAPLSSTSLMSVIAE